ncbi:hypothetical protein [Streptomyces sp. NPDC002250]
MRVALSGDGPAAADPRAQQRLDLPHGAAVRIAPPSRLVRPFTTA